MGSQLADGAGGNVDWAVVHWVNGLAEHLPHGVDSGLAYLGEYGIPLASVLLLLGAWLTARRESSAPAGVAGVLWAGLAAGLALLMNIPVRAMVQRPRPFVDHPGQIDLLLKHQSNGSFASDHATFTMAVAIGLFLVNRRLGLVGIGLAAIEGFLRIFAGVHYPSDILGGYALATAVVLLLAPIAMAVLTPFVQALTRTALAPLVRAPARAAGRGRGPAVHPVGPGDGPGSDPEQPEQDLAA
ncbi:phosphatase PAP2 family protein [Streptacidiphilus fuscans]|uniref:Phosphatase PAP2 family protein n=1 Tax=Streptacidiphilus fuscans TaxID=2789292 RepID=A0A931FEZ3_9ACTN|nr:phosphatase PAP2 family protein [Streptacidiphilus fuscans]MBF9072317.1 phosphatase PAP2 family protein [Streptacidiphilus fuscans]